jgi:Ti-type conjugative transfer relaxase TraA
MERRKDSQEARELLLAMPSDPELGLEHWQEMVQEFAQEHFVSKGLSVQIDIHAAHEGEVNVHAHLLITTRRVEGERFAVHKARDLDPEVRTLKGGLKAVTEAERWGVLWREYQNLYFERQGLDLRVDEIGPVAQRHEGPVRLRTAPDAATARLQETSAENARAVRDPAWILSKLTERRATFTELDVERLIRKHVATISERTAVRAAVLAQPEIVALHDRQSGAFAGRYTTAEVRAEERNVLTAAGAIATVRQAVRGRRVRSIPRGHNLDHEQSAAFLKATGTDGLVVIEGLAGAGKSHSLTAIREAHERAGWRTVGLAPTNVAAEDLRRSGFSHGSTVHLELYWQENARFDRSPEWNRRTVVIVDEAAMLDTRTYARLMRRAAETGTKVVLAGDDRQLASVERGGMFTALKERHGSVTISHVRRQEQEWQREATLDFSQGRVADGLRAYAEHGHVHWSNELEESRARLLSDWDHDSRAQPTVNRFVYASTNAEVNRLNVAIQAIRAARGEIKGKLEIETVKGKITIGVGERIQFHGNDRKAGIFNGSLATIENIRRGIVAARTDTGRKVKFDAREFRQFGLGYAGTVYRGQGKTQTDVYAIYDNSFAWNARTAYVGMTRHQNKVGLYVSRDLARDEIALARQMARRYPDEASLHWATKAEVVELEAAHKSTPAYDAAMRPRDQHRKAAEQKARPDIARDAGAEEERRREIAGADHEDLREALADDERERLERAREQAVRAEEFRREAEAATQAEQDRLHEIRRSQFPQTGELQSEQMRRVEEARAAEAAPQPEPQPAPSSQSPGVPTSANLRYTEALAKHYDPRDHYASMAKASLAETAAYLRDLHTLDQRIAAEPNAARREALTLRRDIEHAEHMAQVHGRLEAISHAMGDEQQAKFDKERAEAHRERATEARRTWQERGAEHPEVYPSLARPGEKRPGQERPPQERAPEQEREAMRHLDLPAHAEQRHGYKVEWRDPERTRAAATKGEEELRITKGADGTWSYTNRSNPQDRGDILDFEAQRGARTAAKAREALRPELEGVDREQGPLDRQPQQEQKQGREGREHGGPDGPERGPNRRRGRGR